MLKQIKNCLSYIKIIFWIIIVILIVNMSQWISKINILFNEYQLSLNIVSWNSLNKLIIENSILIILILIIIIILIIIKKEKRDIIISSGKIIILGYIIRKLYIIISTIIINFQFNIDILYENSLIKIQRIFSQDELLLLGKEYIVEQQINQEIKDIIMQKFINDKIYENETSIINIQQIINNWIIEENNRIIINEYDNITNQINIKEKILMYINEVINLTKGFCNDHPYIITGVFCSIIIGGTICWLYINHENFIKTIKYSIEILKHRKNSEEIELSPALKVFYRREQVVKDFFGINPITGKYNSSTFAFYNHWFGCDDDSNPYRNHLASKVFRPIVRNVWNLNQEICYVAKEECILYDSRWLEKGGNMELIKILNEKINHIIRNDIALPYTLFIEIQTLIQKTHESNLLMSNQYFNQVQNILPQIQIFINQHNNFNNNIIIDNHDFLIKNLSLKNLLSSKFCSSNSIDDNTWLEHNIWYSKSIENISDLL